MNSLSSRYEKLNQKTYPAFMGTNNLQFYEIFCQEGVMCDTVKCIFLCGQAFGDNQNPSACFTITNVDPSEYPFLSCQ